MNRQRLHHILFAVCLCLAIALPGTAGAYQQADLQGVWEFQSLASGPGAPWWERSRATIASNGSFIAHTNDISGGADTLQASLALSPSGVVTFAGSPAFRGVLDAGTTVLVGTDTWSSGSPGTTELRVGLKMGVGYALSNLSGPWELNIIASGPGAPWWERGRITVAADGNFSGTLTDHLGQPDASSGSLGLTSGGILTLAGSNTGRGAMDVGRTVMVMTSTWDGFAAGTADLTVGVKMASSYALADLVGTWELNSLATGPGAPRWGRGQMTIAANGSYVGSSTASNGESGPISGTYSITPQGVVTRAGSSTIRGALDAGKTVLVGTDIWATTSPGTTELLIATKMAIGATSDVPSEAALSFALDPVRPNPSRASTLTFRLALPGTAPAQLELLDVSGRRVAEREVGSLGAGRHTVALGAGLQLAPGVYMARLRAGSSVRVARVVVLD
ncbi:MAG: T9SS type A sorting domain-containing protein [Candidatus Eisenbacteria bacterium]|uniref:T9SS type A sorting domain-containing protein n=1 Tax=Eiseniibacteriota bacterium TaxID=2212470 RepID=A0A849SMJ2_UNCEI|nr:T9SS type A sorting domain-containing protein [Candidatus Eisenbacteria bacterium]